MSITVDLFCEDSAHEAVGRALVARAAATEAVDVTLRVASAQCGIPRLKRELRAFQDVIIRNAGTPDVLVILIDANDVGPASRRRDIQDCLDDAVFPKIVIGTPDPCVERWLLADPESFAAMFGIAPSVAATRDRRVWKRRLADVLRDAGEIVTQGGAEFADEVFATMDLYRASRAVPTIGAFMDELCSSFRLLRTD